MEDLLPFLAGLAYMAYKIYSNYQKGQEEARNRNPSQPYQNKADDAYEEWEEEDRYRPQSLPDHEPIHEKYQEPKYEPVYREPIVETSYKKLVDKKESIGIPHKVELYNPEIPAEEVIRNREIHASHKHKFVASHEEEEVYANFDFKDAIVKEAILNRPEY